MENVNVLHPGNKVNDPKVKHVRSSNNFDEKYALAHGQRFGQLFAPFFFDAVAKDRVTLRSAHNIRSYTLKSPLLSDVSLKKDFFQVTRRAILPENFEKFFDNPVQGDDVSQDVGTTVANFDYRVAELGKSLTVALSGITTGVEYLQAAFTYLVFLSYFYSYGSLLAASGYSIEEQYVDGQSSDNRSADQVIDDALATLVTLLSTGSSSSFGVYLNGSATITRVYADTERAISSGRSDAIGLRRFFELISEGTDFVIYSVPSGFWDSSSSALIVDNWAFSDDDFVPIADSPLDLARLFAYQLCCAHFYTNDSIDFVYSADLYRQVVRSAVLELDSVSSSSPINSLVRDFVYNGISCRYDDCSAHNHEYVLDNLALYFNSLGFNLSSCKYLLHNLSIVYGWRNSLRFTDYFTGVKAHPLAVGDINIAVNIGSPNYVSVIDVTKNIQRQRFFNAVNRTGRKIEQYLEGIFGAKPSHDWHNPLWLGHTKDIIIADEVENNTFNPSAESIGNDEQLVSATLRGAANNFAFEVQIDEPSILVGISYFDIPRFYVHASERIMMHQDRFDMFNPFMQFIGDQSVIVRELSDNPNFVSNGFASPNADIFGFTMRHMEYKQRFSRAIGPFATGVLPSWIFTDSLNGRGDVLTISPDYIRSSCIELDKFYTSLNYHSPANYFHFIVITYNECHANRNMVYSPNIL